MRPISKLLLVPLVLAAGVFVFAQTNIARMISGVNPQIGASYTFVPADSTRLVTFANAGAVAVNLPAGTTAGFGAGNEFAMQNLGPGTVTITCASCLIFSVNSSGSATLQLLAGQGADLFSNGVNYIALAGVAGAQSGFPGSAQVGDILRFNVNGDSAWDAVNAVVNLVSVNEVLGGCGNTAPNSSGIYGTGTTRVLGPSGFTPTGIAPTNTVPAGCQMATSSTAGTVYLGGWFGYQNGNNSILPIRAWYRTSFRLSVSATANSRYWFGIGTWNNGSSLGTNGTTFAQAGNTKYATDTPGSNTIGFRYSAGTDTHWQAATITAGGSSTFVDTGITPDANVHLFEMVMNLASTTVTFYIDNVLVATISTNIPPTGTSSQGDAAVDLFMLEDNKNVAAAVTFTFYDCHMALR